MQEVEYERQLQEFLLKRDIGLGRNEAAAKERAFDRFCEYLKSGNGRPYIEISNVMCTSDAAAVKVTLNKEVERDPMKIICMYQIGNGGAGLVSEMGTLEVEPGFVVRKLATVKTGMVVGILVKDDKTVVRRNYVSTQTNLSAETLYEDVRTFPRACSLCSIRVSDRRIAFLFGVGAESLGCVAFCRFNESYTSVEVTQRIDLDALFGLACPLADILLTERSLCVVDKNGDVQSFDLRTRQTSKKTSCGKHNGEDDGEWLGGLMSFADELVVGRAKLGENKRLCIRSMSNEDHRALPSAVLEMDMPSTELVVGSMGDVLYVVDVRGGNVYSSELSVTVTSEAYRIQRYGNGAKSSQQEIGIQHWLRLFYHVFEKFPVRSLIDVSMNPDTVFSLGLEIAVSGHINKNWFATKYATSVCVQYLNNVMVDLRRLNKPLCELDLVKNLKYRCSELIGNETSLQITSVQHFLLTIALFVPVQICRAEDNMLKLLQNGQNVPKSFKGLSVTSCGDNGNISGTDASKIAQAIRFGFLSPLLESWNGPCVVVTSMGKQSTGKSYFLNHLAGTSFAMSGSRCTNGAWMSLRFVSARVLLVILDFEGLGSFERSEQEDVFLSVLNASVSMFTVFRMESRFDKDIDGLFSRFQKGVQLIKNDPQLFRGLLYMSVKDVNMNDQLGVVNELVAKLDAIFVANKKHNFLTEMYAGQLEINCTPPLGTIDYYECMKNDAAKALCDLLFTSEGAGRGFSTGKAFLDCVRIVLAKISILDWTVMDKSTQSLLVADTKQKLPGILRTGCHVSLPLVADETIPLHLKEDVLQVGSFKKIVVSLKEMCEANPGYKTKWVALDDAVPLDSVKDEDFDMGFDVTSLSTSKLNMVQNAIGVFFHSFLNLRGKAYDSCKLTTEDQSDFDAFEAFVLRRRKKKVSLWLHSSLGDHLSEVRTQLEQRYVDLLTLYMSRCQQRCKHCQLGCMHSAMHAPEITHNCYMDHKCRGQCEYGECQTNCEAAQVPACSQSAGHEGKCECEKGEHTCGKPCALIRASNCDKTCSKLDDHVGDHRCSVPVHVCGVACSATTCTATCLLDIQRDHSVHKCAEVQCLQPCLMDGCNNLCGEKNHFHGQHAVSRAFMEESGMAGVSEDPADNGVVTHMCSCSHACREMCTVDGICEQKVHLKRSTRTYTGARGSFEYIYQEMNGCKKRCAHMKPSGEVYHKGLGHTCLVPTNEEHDVQNTVHYCDARCPSCNYYCDKGFGHMGLHATSHGNMRNTYFMAKVNDIEVENRQYRVGERGTAEMCNLFCAKVGRGHVHYLSCESNKNENCVYTSGASKDRRRHCVHELFPPPDREMDELLHAQFWTAIGWEDPCNEEERAVFAKCAFQCNAPEHEGVDREPSYCVLDAWHDFEAKEAHDDDFAYVDGHKFGCVHSIDTDKFHSIFVLDSSGSMDGQPWQDLLCACKEFGISRLSDGGKDDVVSYITFDNESQIVCEGELLPEALKIVVPFTGGQTYFRKGLRAANEVLSRNNFDEFKTALIFFSDGYPNDIGKAIRFAQHIRSTYAKYDLKAFVVGFGCANLPVLQLLAAEIGGEYRQVLNAEALRTEFLRIAAVLCKNEASLVLLESQTDAA